MERKSVSEDEKINLINNAIDELDDERLESLKRALQFQRINHERMQLELRRVERKYGTSHDRTEKLGSRISDNISFTNALELQIKLIEAQAEKFDEDTWRVQGFVTGGAGEPLPGLLVFISMDKREDIQEFGMSQTDVLGFYSITIEAKMVSKFSKDKDLKLFLAVAEKKRVIHKESDPLSPTAGLIDIENIYIPGRKTREFTGIVDMDR